MAEAEVSLTGDGSQGTRGLQKLERKEAEAPQSPSGSTAPRLGLCSDPQTGK